MYTYHTPKKKLHPYTLTQQMGEVYILSISKFVFYHIINPSSLPEGQVFFRELGGMDQE